MRARLSFRLWVSSDYKSFRWGKVWSVLIPLVGGAEGHPDPKHTGALGEYECSVQTYQVTLKELFYKIQMSVRINVVGFLMVGLFHYMFHFLIWHPANTPLTDCVEIRIIKHSLPSNVSMKSPPRNRARFPDLCQLMRLFQGVFLLMF